MDILVQFLLEVLLQLLFQGFGFFSDGTKKLSEKFTLILKAVSYLIIGFALGMLSFILLPNSVLGFPPNVILSVGFVPLTVAVVCVYVSPWNEKNSDVEVSIPRFIYSYIFALSFALARFAMLTK